MKQYEIKTETGPIHRECAMSFYDLASKIAKWPAEALPSLLGESYQSNGRDWYVIATATKHGKPTDSRRAFWIRIDGLGNVECNHN